MAQSPSFSSWTITLLQQDPAFRAEKMDQANKHESELGTLALGRQRQAAP